MPIGRPRINSGSPLTAAERQARHRHRGRDAAARIAAARQVIERTQEAVRLCGDVEVVAAWLELTEILGVGEPLSFVMPPLAPECG